MEFKELSKKINHFLEKISPEEWKQNRPLLALAYRLRENSKAYDELEKKEGERYLKRIPGEQSLCN